MSKIKLKNIDTLPPKGVKKEATKKKLAGIMAELDELQNLMYAENKHSLLVILQGMDASGKDGLIRDVFSSMNPQGVNVKSFKEPTPDELAHDFLWRVHAAVPARGMMHVFNRSHYEAVLITRVHGMVDDSTALKRMDAINDFEKLLVNHNDTTILKFYLHVSHDEQRKRLEERTAEPRKMWKYNDDDFKESTLWGKYMDCYEDVFHYCDHIPWHIIPADHNWYKSFLIATAIRDELKKMKMKYPGIKK